MTWGLVVSSKGTSADMGGVDRSRIFQALPTSYVVLTPELLIADMNDAYLAVTGRTRAELTGQYFLHAFPPPSASLDSSGRSELQISLERVRDTGFSDTLPVQKYPIAGADGVMAERHWLAVHVPILDAAGSVEFIVQRTEDITEFSLAQERAAERIDDDWRARIERVEADLFVRARELADAVAAKDESARRVAILAEASLALASASTLEEVERIIVGRALPVLGSDGGGIVSPDPNGGWRITVNESLGEHVQQTYPDAPYDSMIPGCWSARTGRRLMLPTRDAGLAFDHEVMAGIYDSTQRSGWAFVPLTIGDRKLGSLAVSWVDEHELADDELDILDGLAAQCAQALLRVETEQAQHAAAIEVQQLAEALQQALLTPPPQPDHLQLATRYLPAGHHAQIGGDWYDAFLQPDGATILVIGDVTGHDSTAAAKMGQLRGVLRTIAYGTDSTSASDTPAGIVSRFDRVARGLEVNTLATAIVARVEQPSQRPGGTRVLRWTNAGHPPPVLLHADGSIEILDTEPELLLGFDPDARRSDHTTDLPDGCTLLLYTDGLVERRGASYEARVEQLRLALADLAHDELDDLCDTLLTRLAPEPGDDDIALLAIRAHTEEVARPVKAGAEKVPELIAPEMPQDARHNQRSETSIDLPFDSDAPRLAREFVRSHAPGLPDPVREDAELLVSELVTNAVRYGEPGVYLRLRSEAGIFGVMVADHGRTQPPLPLTQPDPTSPSGRGLLIIAAVADDWGIETNVQTGGKTVWFELHEPDVEHVTAPVSPD